MAWGLPPPQLLGGSRGGAELAGAARQGGAFDGQFEVGDGAVDGVVLGALGVGVDPADEILLGGGDAAADDDVPAREDEGADARRLLDRGRADRAEPAEPVRLAVQHQHPRGNPGAGAGAELDPGGTGVEGGAGRGGESGALEPTP